MLTNFVIISRIGRNVRPFDGHKILLSVSTFITSQRLIVELQLIEPYDTCRHVHQFIKLLKAGSLRRTGSLRDVCSTRKIPNRMFSCGRESRQWGERL
ncbi:BEM_HP_G0009430.mRNA.1.CDS.1 [Saccharomyces cerevisiae]|nr:BEM_HP_G0009430.mRNA.1.CDS.1 [Saccharomyces cerevisiae]CAI6889944.1 BEM_HP_G0009430.mRNA.1.CDS.1 [Saccharomyces cerevisiae]